MAFTGVLGTIDSSLGSFVLGSPGGSSGPDFDPHIHDTLTLSQAVGLGKSVAVSASNTLAVTDLAFHFTPLTPIIGYSGGLTRYVFVRDITYGQDLYSLNPDTIFTFPASTTKLMTALLIYEYKNAVLDSGSVTFISADLSLPGGVSSAGFAVGDTCTWRELLYGIFLPSGGDACQCAARIIGHEIFVAAGSTGNDGMARFVDTMNARAVTLGMTNATYIDPWGLSTQSGVDHNLISVRDCNTVTIAAYSIPTLVTISGTATKSITTGGGSPQTLNWTNTNRFINGPTANQSGIKDADVLAGKTGDWSDSGVAHFNLSQLWQAPNGNLIVITTFNSESNQAMTFDQQGIIYSILRDWPYLEDTVTRGDSFFNNVKLLVGGDGVIIDESTVGRSLTVTSVTTGTPVIKSAGALVFNAGSDAVSAADAVDLEIGSGDATFELWYTGPGTVTGSPVEYLFFGKFNIAGTGREFTLNYFFSGRNFNIFASDDGTNWTFATPLTLSVAEQAIFFNGAPRHIAVIKSGSTWALYINGERQTTTMTLSTVFNGPEPLIIGSPSESAIGHYDDVRFTVGVDRYVPNKVTLEARRFPRTSSPDQTASSTLALSHQVARSVTYLRSIEHTLTLTDAGRKVVDGAGSSTLTLTQTAVAKKVRNVIASNSLVLTHDLTREMTYNRSLFQGLPIVHAATRNMYYARAVSQPLTLAQTDTQTNSKLAHNELVLTDDATAEYVHGARNILTLTQSIARNITKIISLHDFLGLFHHIATIGTYNKAVPQTLVLTQIALGQVTKSVSQTLFLSDLAIGEIVTPAFDLISLIDLAGVSKTSNVEGESLLILNQDAQVIRSLGVSASNALGMSQFVKGNKVLHASASNTLALTQELVQQRFIKDVPQTLTLAQAVTVHKIVKPIVQQTLVLSQSVGLSKTIVRTVTDNLVFQNSFQKYIGVASQPYVSVPVVQGVLIKKKCIFTLEAPGLSIVLPCPQFNDGEAGTGKLTVKRAMDGTRRIYRRDGPTSKLKYEFIMDRKKAIELRQFIMTQNSNLLKMTNHKGEIWYVLLTNSPFTFVETAYWESSWGNKSTVTLELEGTRVN